MRLGVLVTWQKCVDKMVEHKGACSDILCYCGDDKHYRATATPCKGDIMLPLVAWCARDCVHKNKYM